VTRTLGSLLIAVSMGAVVSIMVRMLGSRGPAAVAGVDTGAGTPPDEGGQLRPPAPDSGVDDGEVTRHSNVFESVGPQRPSATAEFAAPALPPAPIFAPAAPIRHASIEPLAGPVVIGAEPGQVANRRRRGVRSPLGVGLLALAVIAAGVGGTFAYKGITDDDAQNVASTQSEPPTHAGASTSAQPGPAPLPTTRVGAKSGGTLDRMTVAGSRSGVTADVWVWTPPGYDDPANQGRDYPVLVAQSSLPGIDANSFVDGTVAFLPKLAAAIEAGTIPPYIVVAPELMPYPKKDLEAGLTTAKDTECSDIPGKPKMATFHNDDVREAVLATYRTAADRASWALIGDGSGGMCAIKYALQYPQFYATAVSLSGRTNLKSPLWSAVPQAKTANSPTTLLAAAPDVRVLLSGHAGTSGEDFALGAKSPTVVTTAKEPGSASSDITLHLPEAFAFLGDNATNPTP